jgi:pimeloyl-ACP methyl ester carboxylesterase
VPTISRFYGIVIRMYFSDHAPPHFHAVYSGDEAVVAIETGEVIRGALPAHGRCDSQSLCSKSSSTPGGPEGLDDHATDNDRHPGEQEIGEVGCCESAVCQISGPGNSRRVSSPAMPDPTLEPLAATVAKPFEQGRFEDLPERPRLPHPYYDADTEDVVVDSRPFGRVRVHVASYGPRDAPPLLLVHGLMTSSYSWRYLFQYLGDRYRLVAPDLPGTGRSQPAPQRPHTGTALATFIGEFQAAAGLDGCLAVASSLGGYLCMRRALDDPQSFARLAVVHAPGVPEPRLTALHVAIRIPGVAHILRRVIRHDPLGWAHKNVHYYDESLKSLEEAHEYGDPLASDDGARAFIRYLGDSLDPRELKAFTRALAKRRDASEPFPMPVTMLYAREDPTVPPANGPKLRALVPDAEFHFLERTSHFMQVDAPDRLTPLLLDFLER